MIRSEWNAFHQALRSKSREHKAKDHRFGALRRWEYGDHIMHGFTYWTVRHMRGEGAFGLACYPSIIRDRSTCSRIDDALAWAAHYRQLAKRERHMRRQHLAAARSCIADAREIRLSGSIFHQIAA